MRTGLVILSILFAFSCSDPEAAPGVKVGTHVSRYQLKGEDWRQGGFVQEVKGTSARIGSKWVDFSQVVEWQRAGP